MSIKNDGGPAYPQHGWTNDPETLKRMDKKQGMSLRDWFAGHVLGACSSHADPQEAAEYAYQYADAMLKAREQ